MIFWFKQTKMSIARRLFLSAANQLPDARRSVNSSSDNQQMVGKKRRRKNRKTSGLGAFGTHCVITIKRRSTCIFTLQHLFPSSASLQEVNQHHGPQLLPSGPVQRNQESLAISWVIFPALAVLVGHFSALPLPAQSWDLSMRRNKKRLRLKVEIEFYCHFYCASRTSICPGQDKARDGYTDWSD